MAETLIDVTTNLERANDVAALRTRVDAWRAAGETVVFVPTMGALHEGHLSLVRKARKMGKVVASIFVNPTQFGPDEDLTRYPRTVETDCDLLAREGCDLVFLPAVEHLYPVGCSTTISVAGPSAGFEGAERPGHFQGVATVVLALFQLVRPDVAIFGQKDAQQLAVIRQMVRDLHLGVEIVGAPIVREGDGLALSSRNIYLSVEHRRAARVLSRALRSAEKQILEGERDAEAIREHVQITLDAEPAGQIDYIGIVNADTFEPLEKLTGRVVIPIAVRFAETRLLDNLLIDINRQASPLRPSASPQGASR